MALWLCETLWYSVNLKTVLKTEVILPAHAAQDREVKRRYYEVCGVQEYWLVDPQHQHIEFLRLVNGQYQLQHAAGRYRPHNIANLAFIPTKLWQPPPYQQQFTRFLFDVEHPLEKKININREKNGLGYGSSPFAPRVALEPVPILFEEFISWCPEAKIEGHDGKLEVGDTRHLLFSSIIDDAWHGRNG